MLFPSFSNGRRLHADVSLLQNQRTEKNSYLNQTVTLTVNPLVCLFNELIGVVRFHDIFYDIIDPSIFHKKRGKKQLAKTGETRIFVIKLTTFAFLNTHTHTSLVCVDIFL